MPKHTRYPGIQAMSDGRKRIRVRAVDPRTGRMKEVDRVVTVSKEDAIRLQQEWRRDIHTADRQSAEVPRLTDYATSWMKSKAIAVKPSTAETYATVLDCHVMPAGGDQATVHRPWLPAHVQQHRAPGGRGDRHAIDHGARHAGHDRALLARWSRGEAGRGRKRGAARVRSENGDKWGIKWGIAETRRSVRSAMIAQPSVTEVSARKRTRTSTPFGTRS